MPNAMKPVKDQAIELRVGTLSQLFDTLDPFPFRERDLDPGAEDYIVGWARELPREQPLRIVIHLPHAEATPHTTEEIRVAFMRYFDYRADAASRDLKELFRMGRGFLLVGACIMAAALTASQFMPEMSAPPQINRFISESLVLVAWVANWKPIEIFLYDWWPIVRRRSLYRRLRAAELFAQAY